MNTFDQERWDRQISCAFDVARGCGDAVLVRFNENSMEHSPHSWLRAKHVPGYWASLYNTADVLVRIDATAATLLRNTMGLTTGQLLNEYFRLTGAAPKETEPVQVRIHQGNVPLEPPKEELWWQRDQRVAKEQWAGVVALRNDVRKLLGR